MEEQMEQFTEEHAQLLLDKEWMVKTDKAKPYLFKYHFSPMDMSCLVMVTDTKMVWAEVVNSKLLARRWRLCNPSSPERFAIMSDEDDWRERMLELITKAHTIGGIADLSFEVVDSKFSDLALELECDVFKWRWETCFLGHQRSSEIISKQLIFPLISLNHLSFSSAEAVGELSDTDLEKAVDKIGRTARRTVDTHIKNALSKPRVSTSIRRMTALFNFVPNLPPVISIADKPHLHIEQIDKASIIDPPKISKKPSSPKYTHVHEPLPKPAAAQTERNNEPVKEIVKAKATEQDASETESESDHEQLPTNAHHVSRSSTAGPSNGDEVTNLDRSSRHDTPLTTSQIAKPGSDSDSSPHRPVKKIKTVLPKSSDEDSNSSRKLKDQQSGPSGGGIKRGTRQPIKRGGKRF